MRLIGVVLLVSLFTARPAEAQPNEARQERWPALELDVHGGAAAAWASGDAMLAGVTGGGAIGVRFSPRYALDVAADDAYFPYRFAGGSWQFGQLTTVLLSNRFTFPTPWCEPFFGLGAGVLVAGGSSPQYVGVDNPGVVLLDVSLGVARYVGRRARVYAELAWFVGFVPVRAGDSSGPAGGVLIEGVPPPAALRVGVVFDTR